MALGDDGFTRVPAVAGDAASSVGPTADAGFKRVFNPDDYSPQEVAAEQWRRSVLSRKAELAPPRRQEGNATHFLQAVGMMPPLMVEGLLTMPQRVGEAATEVHKYGVDQANIDPIIEAGLMTTLARLPSGPKPNTLSMGIMSDMKGIGQSARKAGQTVEKIFSPDTVDASARAAAGDIRAASGQAARDTAVTETAVEPFWKKISSMPNPERLNLLDYMENRSGKYAGTTMRDPEMQSIANTLRTEFDKRMDKLQQLPSTQAAHFIEDYFPHFWKDPAKAAQFAKDFSGGPSRQGSGASLRKRTVPTIGDGIRAGLEPLTLDPLEATMKYATSMDRFIATTEVLDIAKANGTVKWVRPKVMGASGHPESFKVPEGYVALKGRGTTNPNGATAYAPEGYARIYNNYVSRGFAELGEEWGKGYNAVRRTTNATTALELGLSGYHTLTMAQEAMVNQLANSLGYLRKGRFSDAAKSFASVPFAPVQLARTGKKVQDVYLGLTPGTAEMREVVDLLTQAGGRAKGSRHAPDYEFSSAGSYVTALKRGQLKMQTAADLSQIRDAPISGTTKVAARHIGRIMDTVAQPIFEKYIPLIKNGAFKENLAAWLKQNPNASQAERVSAARQIQDSVDNRFGEMVSDNVFWNQMLKQTAQVSLRSWSWSFGGVVREIGGGIRDATRAPFKRPTGTGPQDTRWTQKMDYVIALPIVYSGLSTIYQFLKTGEPPRSIHDLLAPRTGGTDAATGQPERLMIPGYMKDVFGFYEHPVGEATNKIGTAPQVAGQLLKNSNWRGDPIFSPRTDSMADDAPRWLKDFWNYATQTLGPISGRDMAKGKKTGSNLSAPEKILGVRTAPRYLTDPEGFETMIKGIRDRKWKSKERYDRRQQGLYEGVPTDDAGFRKIPK